MGFSSFEQINAWKEARKMTNHVYRITKDGNFAQDFGLRVQIQRASISAMANIADGFGGGSDASFVRFLEYGFRSATEVQSHLYVALDQDYINEKSFHDIYEIAKNVKSMISGLIKYVEK